MLKQLDALFEEAKTEVGDFAETPGKYEAELVTVKFDATNKWKAKNGNPEIVVPVVNLTFKILEGEEKDNLSTVRLNLGGRTPENRNIALSVFASTARKLGVDLDGLGVQDTIKALNERVGTKATIELKQSGEYINTVVC